MDNLDFTQLEQLKAIGAYLYEIRQDQARTLEEIAAKTYIPLRLLKALEAGQEKALPEPVFVQGFIRRYADALGLDGLALAQQFPIHAATAPEVPSSSTETGYEAPPPPVAVIETPSSSRKVFARRSRSPYLPYLTAAIIAAVILMGLIYSFSRLQPQPQADSTAQPDPSPEPPSETVAPAPSVVASSPVASSPAPASPAASSPTASSPTASSPTATATPSPTASPTNAPVAIDVNLTDRSWIQVIVDGRIEFEGLLSKGEQRRWTAQRQITVVAGNAGAVMVSSNNRKAEAMGEPGLVEERTFTATPSTN